MRYDKLVRDRIPDIIREKGGSSVTHIADEAEYRAKLKEKLREEVEEYLKDEAIGEIADILEVIEAICINKGFSREAVREAKERKAEERGRFERRIILEES